MIIQTRQCLSENSYMDILVPRTAKSTKKYGHNDFLKISIYFWLFRIILSFLEKKSQNKLKIKKNHCDLIYLLILKFLVPKCSKNQMLL